VLAVLASAAAVTPAAAVAASGLPSGSCTGDPAQTAPLTLDVGGQVARGRYALPAAAPTARVVMAHGYSHRVEGWVRHLSRVATNDGALTVAMNYRGLTDLPPDENGIPRSRGYPVKAGGEDLNAAARALLAACPSIRSVVLLGISMGGNASGMAVAARPKRADGTPLYDHWIGVEGAFNLTELYEGSRVVSQISEFAALVKEDIEIETGGTPETQFAAYSERTIVNRSADIAAAGLQSVTFVHGIEDGLAPYDNGEQMTRLMRGQGVPTDFYTVTRRGADDDPDTTLGGYAGLTTGLAGHGGELSEKHAVIDTGFARLHALLSTTQPRPCGRDFTYDGLARTTSPDPGATSAECPASTPLARPAAPPGAGPCADATRPSLARPRTTVTRARRLSIRGTLRDRACGEDSTAAVRVDVTISRTLRHGRCAAVRPSGRLSAPARCGRRTAIRARRSGATYLLVIPRSLPGGRYAIRVVARDRAGNTATRALTVRVR
jgi:hypothetical protein